MASVNFYKIVCNETKRIYVGSTILPINARLNQHERNFRKYQNERYSFTTSYIIFERKNYTIELIDTVVCVDKKHRDTLETLHILNEGGVNRILPGRARNNINPVFDEKQKEKEKDEEKQNDNNRMLCVCGGVYKKTTKLKHFKTKRHIKYENEKQNDEREKQNNERENDEKN